MILDGAKKATDIAMSSVRVPCAAPISSITMEEVEWGLNGDGKETLGYTITAMDAFSGISDLQLLNY